MERDDVLSEAEKCRVSIWLSVLQKICNYCDVCEKTFKDDTELDLNKCGSYYVGGHKIGYYTPHVIEKGLYEAAIVGFSSIFISGNEGGGIADNKNNSTIMLMKKDIILRASQSLGYENDDALKKYIQDIKDIRNQIVAHYDGSKAEYEKSLLDQIDDNGNVVGKIPGIATMRMPSAIASLEKVVELNKVAIHIKEGLLSYINEISKK